jgi:hypothetical protein
MFEFFLREIKSLLPEVIVYNTEPRGFECSFKIMLKGSGHSEKIESALKALQRQNPEVIAHFSNASRGRKND